MTMAIESEGETYLNTQEAITEAGVSRDTLNRYVRQGRIKRYRKVGRASYYKRSELIEATKIREA